MTLIVIHCNDSDSYSVQNVRSSCSVIGLMEVYTIPCHDRGYINVMLVLQSCSDSLHILPGSSSETNGTSDGVCNISNTEVEEDVDVIDENFISVYEDVVIGIKQEEIPGDINFPAIKSDPDEVSYVCVCLFWGTFYQHARNPLFL
jgi:hypothetical protein